LPWLTVEAHYFEEYVKDLIQWTPNPAGQWSPANIGSVEKRGADVSLSGTAVTSGERWTVSYRAGYSFLSAENTTSGSTYGCQLPFRPYHSADGYVQISHHSGMKGGFSASYMGFRWLTAENTKFIPSYIVLGSYLSFQVLPGAVIKLSLDNILDREYYDVQYYPVPGRTVSLSLSYRPNKPSGTEVR
jgi:outer membrane receptor protein involved in Fe transport